MNNIPYGRQEITLDDIDKVVQVLNSEFLTQGPMVPKFEDSIKKYCGVNHAVAVNSATSALHIAYKALGLSVGDIVWTSPNTFVATSNAALLCGASIDFVDVDEHGNMCVFELEQKLQIAERAGKLPKVVTPVHFAGLPCNMDKIHKLSKQYNFRIVEDASHAIGSEYKLKKTGSCLYSDICIFSLHPVKIITSGEGGLATTNCQKLFDRMVLLRSHGVTRDREQLNSKSDEGAWYYEQQELGFNYRMTDIHAALALSQLNRLDTYVKIRNELAGRYLENLIDPRITLPSTVVETVSSWHLFVIKLDQGQNRKQVFNYLRSRNIGVNVHYIPVHYQPYYQSIGFKKGFFPKAEKAYGAALSLPIFPTLSNAQQDYVIENVFNSLE